jgi:transposase, IS6 family
VDLNGCFIDFLLTRYRDTKAAKAFLKKLIESVLPDRPTMIVTDKADAYIKVIQGLNQIHDPHFDSISYVDQKYQNNRIESNHAAFKRFI